MNNESIYRIAIALLIFQPTSIKATTTIWPFVTYCNKYSNDDLITTMKRERTKRMRPLQPYVVKTIRQGLGLYKMHETLALHLGLCPYTMPPQFYEMICFFPFSYPLQKPRS